MPVNASDAVLLNPKNKKVLALYSKVTHAIEEAWQLHVTGTGGTPSRFCPVTIWVDVAGNVNMRHHTGALPGASVIPASAMPGLWLDGTSIIIGTGDMRDLTARMGGVDLARLNPGDFVVSFVNDYQIEIRCSQVITMNAVVVVPSICE